MQAGAEALLALHIAGATAALISGPAAMILPKGGRLHRQYRRGHLAPAE